MKDSEALAAYVGRASQIIIRIIEKYTFDFTKRGLEKFSARVPCTLRWEDLHNLDDDHLEALK